MKKLTCPQCKKENTVPIIYGFIEDFGADEEDYEVGGCIVTDNDPDCSCRDCGYKWVHTGTK